MDDSPWQLAADLAQRNEILDDYMRLIGEAIAQSPDVTVTYRPGDGKRLFQRRCVWDTPGLTPAPSRSHQRLTE